MEVDEDQLNLFGESVLQLHDKIYELMGLMKTQVDETTKLAQIVEKLNNDVRYLMNEKFNSDSERMRIQNQVMNLENDVYMKTSYGSRSHEKLNDVVMQMKQQMDRFNDGRLATSMVTLMEIFRIHLNQLDERDKAEIMSVLASSHGYSENAYQLGLMYQQSELLRLAATLLNQPESIITLYR